ncbi:hypothetical protein ABFY27_08565 [Akkermansia massiliensis]
MNSPEREYKAEWFPEFKNKMYASVLADFFNVGVKCKKKKRLYLLMSQGGNNIYWDIKNILNEHYVMIRVYFAKGAPMASWC